MAAELCTKSGAKLANVNFTSSDDVYNVHKNENAKNARFQVEYKGSYMPDDLVIKLYLDGAFYKDIELKTGSGYGGADDKIAYTIDMAELTDVIPNASTAVINNGIISIYKVVSYVAIFASIVCYFYICVKAIKTFKDKKEYWKDGWLISTAFLMSALVYIALVSYCYYEPWHSVRIEFYITGAFPVLTLFKYYSIAICCNGMRRQKSR